MSKRVPVRFGRYRVLGELGRGAMGVVYKAEDPSLGRVVAVKAVQLTDDADDSIDLEARFRQEAKAAGSISHRGIITIYDTGRQGNWAYIAMEFLDGVELRGVMAQGRVPLRRLLDIAAQIADALGAAHARGVVHRDIKPGNIMITAGDHVKIMDFGVARMLESTIETQAGQVVGSPRYMSPEQVAGRGVDHRSDIFSLGVVLFEMVAGIAPFSGEDVRDLIYAVANSQPPRPSRFNPAAPEMLDLIIAKAMQKDAAERYQSAGEFASDLRMCRETISVAAEPPDALGESTVVTRIDSDATVVTAILASGDAERRTAPAAESANSSSAPTTIALPSDEHIVASPPRQMRLSRRFSSTKALARLAQPDADDLKRLSKAPVPSARVANWLRGPRNRLLAGMLVAATLGAIAIALS